MGEERRFSYDGFWEEPGDAFRTARIVVCEATALLSVPVLRVVYWALRSC